jgi:hypothetical protein
MCDADAVMLIGEQWIAAADPDNPFLYPSDMADRGELLSLDACSADGEEFGISSEIHREDGITVLGKPYEYRYKISMLF